MKDTFGVDSCLLYGRCTESSGGSSVCERNGLLTDSLSLGSVMLPLSPDANPTITSFVPMLASATLLDSRGDDSETTGMLVASVLKAAVYNKCNVIVLQNKLTKVVRVNHLAQLGPEGQSVLDIGVDGARLELDWITSVNTFVYQQGCFFFLIRVNL